MATCGPWLLFQAERKQSEAEERRRKEIERRMRPRTTADFEILYNELEAWRLQVRYTPRYTVQCTARCTIAGALNPPLPAWVHPQILYNRRSLDTAPTPVGAPPSLARCACRDSIQHGDPKDQRGGLAGAGAARGAAAVAAQGDQTPANNRPPQDRRQRRESRREGPFRPAYEPLG
eukprot:4267243-Pyramimonas_sp.AAC.1